ncbi:MAG: LamG domain-containing protein [Candidatus Pacearchaeota archaeon]
MAKNNTALGVIIFMIIVLLIIAAVLWIPLVNSDSDEESTGEPIMLNYESEEAVAPLRGLVLYLPFDGNADDDSVFENHAKENKAEFISDSVSGTALEVEADNKEYVAFGNTLNLGNGDFTISLWLKDFDSSQNHFVISKGDGYATKGYDIRGNDNSISIRISDGKNKEVLSVSNVEAGIKRGKWNHLVWTVDKDEEIKLYVNGMLVESKNIKSVGNLDSGNSFMIGCLNWNSEESENSCDNPFGTDMKLDELRIYKRVLTNDEVKDLYLVR